MTEAVARLLVGVFFSTLLLVETAVAGPDGSRRGSTQSESAESAQSAETEAKKEEAKERFARGLRFSDEGDLSLALVEFERAYQLVPDYRVLYNVGQVSILLGRLARARVALSRYIEEGADELTEDRRAAVLADLEMLKVRTAEVTVHCEIDSARVLVDGALHGETPLRGPLVLDAGDHQIVLEKEGFESESRRLTLAGADAVELELSLEEIHQEEPVIIVQKEQIEPQNDAGPSVDGEKSRVSPWLVAGWASAGSLAGGAVVAGIFGMNASKKARDIEAGPNPDVDAYEKHQGAAKQSFVAADLLAIGAAVTGVTALYFTLREARRGKKQRVGQLHVGVSVSSISLTKRFH